MSSFMSLEDGVASKVLSNDKIGREPFKQFPDKFNSSLWSVPFLLWEGHTLCVLPVSNRPEKGERVGFDTILKM
jgi:hypothetical protein